jgi:hypothetical protein
VKRYHEEKHIIANRLKRYKQLAGWMGEALDNKYVPTPGKFRKSLRCSGCGQPRCSVCHPEKFPKRAPTRQERQAARDLNNEE